jgi:hypothetical protein
MADVAQVCDTYHHGAWFSGAIVEELHEQTSAELHIVGPVIDELGPEPVWTGNARRRVSGYYNVWETGGTGFPPGTPWFLYIWKHIVRIVEMKDPAEIWNIEGDTQDGGRYYGANLPLSESL